MSLLKKGLGVFSSNWIYNILHFVTGVYVVRKFGADGKGFIALFVAGAGFLASILALGQTNSSVYFIKKGDLSISQAIKRILTLCIAAMALIALLFLILREQVWGLLFEGVNFNWGSILMVMSYFPILLILLLLKAYYLGIHDLKNHRSILIATSLGSLILTILLSEFIFESIYAPLISLLITDFAVSCFYVLKLVDLKNQNGPPKVRWKPFFFFGLKSHIATVGNALFSRIDYFVIATYIDLETLGYYSVAKFFYQALMSLPLSINGLLLGTFSEKGTKQSRSLNNKVFKYMLLIMGVVVVVGIFVGPYLIPLIYGAEFAASIEAYTLLLLAAFFIGSSSTFQVFFTGIGRPEVTGKIGLSGGLIKLAFTILLVVNYSIFGIALATLISAVAIFLLRLYYFQFKLLHEGK
ncbi:oligosaccharide flippase family protein [Roseivirga sp. E12]|uniref:oligosaccharide flippase family protein n=1 Tax=Roseivirga sp. E12 TaxID=2819237 RepID=UPI001ABD426D|nr:oligosaccharide flippase family protein [Roseivirga sp. E12]MBO3700886.1 oligosaccharide flippase family protein [Roseivirga sp. E12]